MEIIKDFVCFSLIEGFIFYLFFMKAGFYGQKKFYLIFMIAIINCLTGKLLPPLFSQMTLIMSLATILYFISNLDIITCLKGSVASLIYFLVVEATCSMIYDYIFHVDILLMGSYISKFYYFVPIRILELLLLLKGGEYMKVWFDTIKK